MKLCQINNYQENYTRQLLENLKTWKICFFFLYSTIWGACLVYMQLYVNIIKDFYLLGFLLRVIDIFSKYAWIDLFKD